MLDWGNTQRMSIEIAVIAIVVVLVLLTLIWGVLRPSEQRAPRKPPPPEKRYSGFRPSREDSDA